MKAADRCQLYNVGKIFRKYYFLPTFWKFSEGYGILSVKKNPVKSDQFFSGD